jgi:hypothetical protein
MPDMLTYDPLRLGSLPPDQEEEPHGIMQGIGREVPRVRPRPQAHR